jgi:hypothetical protein
VHEAAWSHHLLGEGAQAVRVVEYTNSWGIQAYGVIFRGDRDPLRYERETEYVRNPKLLWSRK